MGQHRLLVGHIQLFFVEQLAPVVETVLVVIFSIRCARLASIINIESASVSCDEWRLVLQNAKLWSRCHARSCCYLNMHVCQARVVFGDKHCLVTRDQGCFVGRFLGRFAGDGAITCRVTEAALSSILLARVTDLKV